MTNQPKVMISNQQLPEEIALILRSLPAEDRYKYARILHARKWTLRSISRSIRLTVEAVRLGVKKTDSVESIQFVIDNDLPVPQPPTFTKTSKPKRMVIDPHPETLARLRELKPLAERVRANSPRFRAEAEEYTRLIDQAHHDEGVSMHRLAKLLGVSISALQFRLVRYGYKETPTGTSKCYNKIKDENRVAS